MVEVLRDAFIAAAQSLREADVETPELDARLLLCHAAGLTHEAYAGRGRDPLSPEAAIRFEGFIARRQMREPVSRILGMREFYGREFLLGPHTLDPRPDTETLIEAALGIVAESGWMEKPLRLLDLGTGSGCILVTLLAELPQAHGIGTDLSAEAIAVAKENVARLGVGARASFLAADWLDGLEGAFDLILSNPPYIAHEEIAALAAEVAHHDPRLALDGGPDGLDAYRRIASGARARLRPGGVLLLEIGAGQADPVRALLRGAGLMPELEARIDLAGKPRCIVARRAA